MRMVLAGAALLCLAGGTAQAAADCVGPHAPDTFCRYYGYARGTADYMTCTSLIAAYGPGPALSNGYTINFDWTKTLPPPACRPPRFVVDKSALRK